MNQVVRTMFTYVNLHYDWNRNIRLDVFCPFIELLTEQSNINPSLAAKKILTTIVSVSILNPSPVPGLALEEGRERLYQLAHTCVVLGTLPSC